MLKRGGTTDQAGLEVLPRMASERLAKIRAADLVRVVGSDVVAQAALSAAGSHLRSSGRDRAIIGVVDSLDLDLVFRQALSDLSASSCACDYGRRAESAPYLQQTRETEAYSSSHRRQCRPGREKMQLECCNRHLHHRTFRRCRSSLLSRSVRQGSITAKKDATY